MTFPDLLQFVNNCNLVKTRGIVYNQLMKDIWNYLRELKKPIVLYGTGNGADKMLSVCEKYGIRVSGVFSSDSFVRKKVFRGMPVTDYKTACQEFGDMAVLLCFGTSRGEVIENIKRIAAECELYAPDVPVCGDTLFCREYYERRKPEFDSIREMLADEKSKRVFDGIIAFKLTGDINRLFECESDREEIYRDILRFSDNETYLDLGAYRGDTVLSFCDRVKDWKEIIAVEPDVKTYAKLTEATAGIKRITNINAFAGAADGVATLSANGSRGAGAGGATREMKIISVDSLGISPTFIKMDIEGMEQEALSGAKQTVCAYHPKMKIAAYHKSGDLIDIPKEVLSISGDYKIYLRHNPCLPAWDTDYFFI